jgi:hypothetical protein
MSFSHWDPDDGNVEGADENDAVHRDRKVDPPFDRRGFAQFVIDCVESSVPGKEHGIVRKASAIRVSIPCETRGREREAQHPRIRKR